MIVISTYIALYADSIAVITGYFIAAAIIPVLITLVASYALFKVTKQDLSSNKRYLIFAVPITSVVCLQLLVYWTIQYG